MLCLVYLLSKSTAEQYQKQVQSTGIKTHKPKETNKVQKYAYLCHVHYENSKKSQKENVFNHVWKILKHIHKQQWQKLTYVKHPVQQRFRWCEVATTVHIIKSPVDCVRNSTLAVIRMVYKISCWVQEKKSLRLFRNSMMIFLICWHEKTSSHVEKCHCSGKSFRLEEPLLSRC